MILSQERSSNIMENQNSNEAISRRYCWHWMCGRRDSGIFWGIFFIVGGLFWLGKKANWFPTELIEMFWPGVLIVIGVWITASVLMGKGSRRLKE